MFTALLIPMVVLGLEASFIIDFIHLPVKAILVVSEENSSCCSTLD